MNNWHLLDGSLACHALLARGAAEDQCEGRDGACARHTGDDVAAILIEPTPDAAQEAGRCSRFLFNGFGSLLALDPFVDLAPERIELLRGHGVGRQLEMTAHEL